MESFKDLLLWEGIPLPGKQILFLLEWCAFKKGGKNFKLRVILLWFVSTVFTTIMQSDRQLAWANIVEPNQLLQNALSDQDLHCLPFIQQFIDTSAHSKVNLFYDIQSTLFISNSKGFIETLRDIRTSTYQSWESEKNNKLNNNLTNEYVIWLLKLEIYI